MNRVSRVKIRISIIYSSSCEAQITIPQKVECLRANLVGSIQAKEVEILDWVYLVFEK